MSQLAAPPAPPPSVPVSEPRSEPATFRRAGNDDGEEFQYRPMPMSAVIGAVLALISASALFAWMPIAVAALATIVCLIATIRILCSRGEFSGLWLAAGGLVASLAFGVTGVFLTVHRYRQELPPGFERVSFAREISARGIGMQQSSDRTELVFPPEVLALNGKRIYLKGFIYPGDRPYDLTQFILCKDNAACCFGGQPPLEDMLGVTLTGKQTTDYTTSLVGVAGTFRINPRYRGGNLEPVYIMEADHVAPAQTSL
jgi:hypothetical protein